MADIKDLAEIKLKVDLSLKELIAAIRELGDEEREFLIENLLAATSPEYLKSVEEARQDYKEGRTISHAEIFRK